MKLTKEQINLLPTEEEIVQYEKLGWYISPIVLPEELLIEAEKGTKEFYKGVRDFDCEDILGPANDIYTEDKALMNNEYASLQKKEIRDVVHYPLVSAIAAKLARTTEIRLFADALMTKFPAKSNDTGVFGWHTDKAYWPSCSSNDMLTAWIPLQDVSLDMGPMIVIENSHKWDFNDGLRKFCAAGNKNLDQLVEYLEIHKPGQYKVIHMNLKRGQLSFHNGNAFHASGVNTSTKNRSTLTIHMQDKKNVYVPSFKENGEKIIIGYERMCRKDKNGDPDYRDPIFFPVMWSE